MTPTIGTARSRAKINRQMAYIILKKAAMQSSKGERSGVMFAHKEDLLTQRSDAMGKSAPADRLVLSENLGYIEFTLFFTSL